MIDRLIELIKEGEYITPCANNPEYDCKGKKCRDCEREGIAKYLLANGAIVPPFVAGETVWCLEREGEEYVGIIGEMFIAVVGNAVIASAFLYDFGNDIDEALEYYINETKASFEVDVSFFPLNDCFATKEEAEKALAERSRNGRT